MNRFERAKRNLSLDDVASRLQDIAATGSTEDFDPAVLDQLRVLGVALRPKTPEHFVVRVRVPAGHLTAGQVRSLAAIAERHGRGRADITTRAQIQFHGVHARSVADVIRKLHEADLVSRQTLMDSVRSVRGCPLAGLAADAVFDATPVLRQIEQQMTADEQFLNLPKKVNIAVTGCRHQCCHANVQDIALVPARRDGAIGFNVLIGGKISGLDPQLAVPLDVFVPQPEAASILREIVRIYQEHGPRHMRSRTRLVHLVNMWGLSRLREELERRLDRKLPRQGEDLRDDVACQAVGAIPQASGDVAVGLVVPVGRITSGQLQGVAELAENYGRGQVRLTGEQNLLIPHIGCRVMAALRAEPLLREFPLEPSRFLSGTQSCTGREFCSMAAIETKQRALDVADELGRRVPGAGPIRIHWSACHLGCGQHMIADIGLVGRRIHEDGQMLDAVDVYSGGSERTLATKVAECVPCDRLVDWLEHWMVQDSKYSG